MERIVTLTGPSCSGKTTLLNQMLDTGQYTEVISTTTRVPRVGEVNGSTYHFVTPEEFETIEMLERIEYNDNFYGGSVAEFEDKFANGKIPVIIVEPNGMTQINLNAAEKGWEVLNVFIDCSTELQATRFLARFRAEYFNFLAVGKLTDLENLMEEYVGRMVAMQGVEGEWRDIFRKNARRGNITLQEFTKENEARMFNYICNTAKSLGR